MEEIKQINQDNNKDLKGTDRTSFANWVKNTHRKLHDNRAEQVELAKKIEVWRSINQDVPQYKDLDGIKKSGYRDSKFSTMCFIDKAQVCKESWSNIDQMYEVKISDANTPPDIAMQQTEIQKLALDKAMKDCHINLQFDAAYDYFQQWGELISFVGWKQTTLTRRLSTLQRVEGFKDVSIKEDNANMTAIDPMFFEYDTAKFKNNNKENWDSIVKIYKRFETVDNIVNAKYFDAQTGQNVPLYKISKEEVETLKETDTHIEDNKTGEDLATRESYGNLYEVLFLHGDFVFKGKEYKNYIAEVLAGKYLIRFCPNPYYINPFIIEIPELNPNTKRGLAKMKSIIYAIEQRQNEINQAFKLGRLNTNPAMIGSKQALEDLLNGKNSGLIEWEAGMTIAVDDFSSIDQMKPVTFNSNYTENNIAFLSNEIGDNGGVNANAMGNIEKQDRKATDLNLAKAGQDTRLGQTLDSVYKFIIKNIHAIADVLALFKIGTEIVRVFDKKNQADRVIEITDFIRQAHYQYEYKDRNAMSAERSRMEMIYPLLEKAVQGGILDGKETLKMLLETYGFDNLDKIFKPENPLVQLANKVPPQMQQEVAQQLQQIMQQRQVQQQTQELQQKVAKNTERKVLQQQADMMVEQGMPPEQLVQGAMQ